MTFLNLLIKLHDLMSDKLIQALDKKVCEIMDTEDYTLIEVNNGDDFFKFVDKYEIDLSGYLASLKST